MKKFLCYVVLVLLLGIILTPPLVRVFFKEEEEPVVTDKIQLLMCSKNSYGISSSYKNNEAINIKFKHLVDDPNLETYSDEYSLEYMLDVSLKETSAVVKETETDSSGQEVISYYLVYENIDASLLGEFSNYRLGLNEQKQSYVNQGYTCSVIE